MSRFDTSWDRLETARERAFGVSVTYRRANLSISGLMVRRSGVGVNPALEHLIIAGAVKIFEIDTADLVLNNSLIEPERGDIVEEKDGSQYRLTDMGGEHAWEWTNGNETAYRFICQKIK